jgi:MFS family permease
MIFSLVIFMFGSGLCGGSKYVNSMNMLIAARSIQGVGGGGILAMTEISKSRFLLDAVRPYAHPDLRLIMLTVVADMLPLSERGVFSGIIGCVWAFASAIGPLIGGALAKQWQWLFFVNLPLGVVALALVWMFLDIKAPKEDLKTRLKQMDIVGNLLIIGGTTSVIIGIVWGGSKESWDSYTVIVP